MSYSRAASAASSHRAKQELVRLLFGPKHYRRGPEAHRMLDHSIYTHSQLKSAYLERIQELHPDKRRNEMQQSNAGTAGKNNNTTTMDEASQEFISLQEAWRRYEEFAKALTKVNNGSAAADFTMFGVGCSFSDNEAERKKRNEITDQACRGWFSAGQIGIGDEMTDQQKKRMPHQTSLLDEDMFVTEETNQSTTLSTGKRKSLIDHMVRHRG